MPQIGQLTALAIKHGSDKWGPHSYSRHYETQFARFRDREITMLEIGVGGYDDPASGGASLRMWTEYFPRARVFALDIHDKRAHATDRIRIYQGSQDDAELLRRMNLDAGGFDIIIDDGSHINKHVITTFNVLFPLLSQGGLYVVEDTQTSYWPALGGSSQQPDAPHTTMGFFKGLVHGLNHAEFIAASYCPTYLNSNIVSIQFCHNLIFVEKDNNSEPSNIRPDHPLRQL